MAANSLKYLKTIGTIAVGGASGAAVEFFTNFHGKAGQVDWHQLGINSLVGAVIALSHYLLPSPVQPGQPSLIVTPSGTPSDHKTN